MDKNEIKKALYKQKPKADFQYIQNGVAVYHTFIDADNFLVMFNVPVSDMGDAKFGTQMDAQLLNRWID